jgi:HSP20 family molecular chaperone IbpA
MANNALVQKKENRTEITRPERTRNGVTYTPRCDILETADEMVLYADLPGVHSDDVDVRLENGQLEIFAKCSASHGRENYLAYEYGVGNYYRTFTITEAIDAKKIAAELKQGVLTVHLPKSEAVKPKRIAVKGE